MPFCLIRKDKKPLKLNFPKKYNARYLFPKLAHLDKIDDPIFQSSIIDAINSRENLQMFLLGTTDIGENIQEEINLVVTSDKLNDATLHNKFDTVYQNELRRQNPCKILFKGISKCDAQNPVIGTLLSEIESVKFKDSDIKKFLGKAPNIRDAKIKEKLDNLKRFNDARKFNNSGNDNDDNNDNVDGGIPQFFPPR